LFGIWNGYVIRWRRRNDKRDSKRWHIVGRLCVGLLLFMGILPLFSWGVYVINPFLLLSPWHGGVVTLFLAFGCSYWIYDMIINYINGWDWDYSGSKDSRFWRGELYVWIFLVTILLIFGNRLDG